ncbi:unnamed protein product, partial [marine sediment metagenome]
LPDSSPMGTQRIFKEKDENTRYKKTYQSCTRTAQNNGIAKCAK